MHQRYDDSRDGVSIIAFRARNDMPMLLRYRYLLHPRAVVS